MKNLIRTLIFLLPSICYGQTAYIARTGQILFFKTDGPITAINANPTITYNNKSIILSNPIWDNSTFYQPWVAYILPPYFQNANGATWSAPANWITSSSPIPAPNQNIINYTGRLEPDFTTVKKMKVSQNVIGPTANYYSNYSCQANLARRLSNSWGSGVGTTPDGVPTTLNNGSASQILHTTVGNGIDSSGYPGLTGIYMVMWDDSSPNNPTNISLTTGNSKNVTCQLVASGPGIANKNHINEYSIRYNSTTPSNFDLNLWINITNTSNTNTATNIRVFPPGNGSTSDPLQVESHLVKWLAGTKATLRYMANTGTVNSVVNFSENVNSANFAWGQNYVTSTNLPDTSRNIPIAQIGPLVSNIIYSTEAYGAPNPNQYLAPPGSVAGYQFQIPQNWPNLNGWASGEVTTSVPHNLKTGQYISLNNVSIPGYNYSLIPPIFVTSPTNFAFVAWGPPITTTSNYTNTAYASIVLPDVATIPHDLAARVSAVTGCDHWVNIPTCASNAYVDTIAVIVAQNFPAGHKIYVECSNENWNWSYGGTVINACIANLIPNQSALSINAHRSVVVQNRFSDVLKKFGRQNELVRVLGGFTWDTNYTLWSIQEASSLGSRFDAIAIAPYYDLPTFMQGPAQQLTNKTLDMRLYLELLRHCYLYDTNYQNAFKAHYNVIQQASPGTQLITYEGGPQVIIPSGVVPNDPSVSCKISCDAVYHPDFYDCEQALYRACQNGGISEHVLLGLTYPRAWYGWGYAMWGMTTWMGQQPGYGRSNKFSYINNGDGRPHDYENQSVRLQAWQDWARTRSK